MALRDTGKEGDLLTRPVVESQVWSFSLPRGIFRTRVPGYATISDTFSRLISHITSKHNPGKSRVFHKVVINVLKYHSVKVIENPEIPSPSWKL